MRVRVRLFAALREAAGLAGLELDLPEGATPDDAWGKLASLYPALAPCRGSLAASVNRRYVPFDERLSAGDELVFIPPVSGG